MSYGHINVFLFICFLCHLPLLAQHPLQRPVKVKTEVRKEQQDDKNQNAKLKSNAKSLLEGKESGYVWVDLGLSVKWASCNLGASSPELPGDYYSWGGTNLSSSFEMNTCSTYGENFKKVPNWNKQDIAHLRRRGSWRIPSRAELVELKEKCTWRWTSHSGTMGYRIIGPNGKSIFLPATGFKVGFDRFLIGDNAYYWSSEPVAFYEAFQLIFSKSQIKMGIGDRSVGRSIRPVCK